MCFRYLLLCFSCFFLASCYLESSYNGDGILIDKGYQLKGGRYSVDLGEISFSKAQKYEFNFSNLPDGVEFTAGIKFQENIQIIENNRTKISFWLQNETGSLISVEDELKKWVLSHSLNVDGVFAYMREGKDEGRVDCSKGTYFNSKNKYKYKLVVEVSPNIENKINNAIVHLSSIGKARKCT